jgi:hypothetical protein
MRFGSRKSWARCATSGRCCRSRGRQSRRVEFCGSVMIIDVTLTNTALDFVEKGLPR